MNTPLDEPTTRVRIEVNGQPVLRDVACRKHLSDFLRDDCGLKGSHLGCEHGVCGACTVRLDGRIVRGCLVLAAQASGHRVETVESATPGLRLKALQDAFVEYNALQCGYCTPGMLMAAKALLDRNPRPGREEVIEAIAGNLCRCTGYEPIIAAILDVAEGRRRA